MAHKYPLQPSGNTAVYVLIGSKYKLITRSNFNQNIIIKTYYSKQNGIHELFTRKDTNIDSSTFGQKSFNNFNTFKVHVDVHIDNLK